MPQPTYTALATITLGSSASSVTFSSIPATYRDLVLVIRGSASANNTFGIRFNGDTGSNYSYVDAFGRADVSGTVSSANTDSRFLLTVSGAFGAGDHQFITQIMDYSATDKHKTGLTRNALSGSSFPGVGMIAARWANTAAITSIAVLPGAGSMNTGTTLSLYGIAS
jgi:hypothetical protein